MGYVFLLEHVCVCGTREKGIFNANNRVLQQGLRKGIHLFSKIGTRKGHIFRLNAINDIQKGKRVDLEAASPRTKLCRVPSPPPPPPHLWACMAASHDLNPAKSSVYSRHSR